MRSFGNDRLAIGFESGLFVAQIDSEDLNVLRALRAARPLVEELALELLELGWISDRQLADQAGFVRVATRL